MKRKGINQTKRGGVRPGAGRPAVGTIPAQTWDEIKKYAEAGNSEQEIQAGLGITDEQLKDPPTADRFRREVARGNALKVLRLRAAIDRLSGEDSVNTVALEARNVLGWDRQMDKQEPPPDLSSAIPRLRLTIERLAKVRSKELGREVAPAEILIALAYPREGKAVH